MASTAELLAQIQEIARRVEAMATAPSSAAAPRMANAGAAPMLAEVRAWAVAQFGNPVLVAMTITLADGQRREFSAPIAGPIAGPAPLPVTREPTAAGGGELTPCELDIVELLAHAGQRMTTGQIVQALADEGRHHGDSTVALALATLTNRKKILSNERKGPDRGYALL